MNTDRNLLFGVLALQADFLDVARFAEACSAWAARKDTSLANLLVERGWLSATDRVDIEKLVERKLSKHSGDVKACLAEVTGDQVRRSLAGVNDPEVQKSIAGTLSEPAGGMVLLATTAYEPTEGERYTKSRLHASGGIGRVWLARDASLGREVALKELRPERAGHPKVWARFLREAQITGQLEHPGIVPIYEMGRRSDDRQPFYTMRFVRGRTLAEAATSYHERKARGEAGPLEFRELLVAFVGVCNAVAYAHSRGVLHRDLKPQNVVLGAFGEVIVLDWGLAKVLGQPEDEAEPLHLSGDHQEDATIQGQALGTPAYMAPEQAEGRLDLLGTASDVYGLGAILYQLLTGKAPFTGGETEDLLRRVVHEAPARPKLVAADVPPALDAACMKALAKKPSERYANVKELQSDVQHWLADEPIAVYREPFLVRAGRIARRHRTGVAVAAALLITGAAALGVTTILVNQQRSRAERERERAEENFQFSRKAVDEMYTQVAEKWLAQESRMEPVQREFLVKALSFYEKFAEPEGSSREVRLDAASAARRVGAIHHRLGDTSAADAAFRRSIDILRKLASENPDAAVRVELLQSVNKYAWELWAVGKKPEDLLREAEELGESLAANGGPTIAREELALAYSVEAIVDMACGRFADAEKAHSKARPLRKAIADEVPNLEHREAVGRSHYHYARLLTRIGRYRQAQEEFASAVETASKVIRDYPREPRPRVELANDLIEEAGLFSLMGRAKEAETDLRRGLAICEALVVDFPSVTEYKELLAAIRRDLASLLNDKRQFDDARKAYLKAIQEGEDLVKESPDVVSYRWNLCVHLSGLMSLEWSAGRITDAMAPALRALEIAEHISAKAPVRVDYRALVAHRRFEIGDLLSNSKLRNEGLVVYEKTSTEYEALVRECPQVPEYRYSLTQIITRIGDRQREAKDLKAAEASYARALPLAEAMARDFAIVPSYRTAPIGVRTSLGKLAVRRRDAAKAKALLEQSIGELETELKANADDANSRSYLVSNFGYLAQAQAVAGDAAAAELAAKRCEAAAKIPSDLFNCACYLSLLFGEVQAMTKTSPERDALMRTLPERAIVQLQTALNQGKTDLATMLVDTDFDPIRQLEVFAKFRKEVDEATTPKKK